MSDRNDGIISDVERATLVSLYEKNNPSKVAEVDSLLSKYNGNEALMWSHLERKYGAAAISEAEAAAVAMLGSPSTGTRSLAPGPLGSQAPLKSEDVSRPPPPTGNTPRHAVGNPIMPLPGAAAQTAEEEASKSAKLQEFYFDVFRSLDMIIRFKLQLSCIF